MQNNTFNQNYAGMQTSIVGLTNIRKLYIDSDSYINNGGTFKEAMDKYGSITSTGDCSVLTKTPGAWIFAYYGASGSGNTISNLVSSSNQQNYYPVAPLIIDGCFYATISGAIFQNNAMPELPSSLVTNFYPSNAITFRRSQGNLYMINMTIQNYKGFDLASLEEIYGSTLYQSNVVIADPTKRDDSGVPTSLPNYPSFVLDYGFKNSIINFAKPSTISSSDFNNFLDYVEITGLSVSNMAQYNPEVDIAMLMDIKNECIQIVISNFKFKNIDLILASTGMLRFRTYAYLTISDGQVSNININAYALSTSDYHYVGSNGGVFVFNTISSNASYSSVNYLVNNVTFDAIYGDKGAAFYFSTESGIKTSQLINITLNNIFLNNSFSYTYGIVCLESGTQNVRIQNSYFDSNTGVNGEADLRVIKTGSLSISSTLFTLFESSYSDTNGQSVTLTMSTPFAFSVLFNNVSVQCIATPYDLNTYNSYLNNSDTSFTKSAPIVLYPGSLSITNSSFKDCVNSMRGGLVYSNLNSVLHIDSSDLRDNCAMEGGALYISQTSLIITNTILYNNWAITGGNIYGDSKSIISTFDNVSCDYATVYKDGGCLYIIGGSKVTITNSQLSINYGTTSSAIFFLGTGNSSISDSKIFSNYADSSTISLMFAPTIISNVSVYNNIAYTQTTGIFIAFSDVIISNSNFNTTILPDAKYESSITDAAWDYSLYGCFISISSGSNVEISDSKFENGYGSNGGFIFVSGTSYIDITNSTFSKGHVSSKGGAIYGFGHKSINITNCKFFENFANSDGNDLYLDSGTSYICSSEFYIYPVSSSIILKGGNFTSNNLAFINDYPGKFKPWSTTNGGAISASDLETFTIDTSNFTELDHAIVGGAIYIVSQIQQRIKTPSNPIYNITECNFIRNKAYEGGAIYIDYIDYAKIDSCVFDSNSAYLGYDGTGNGGAIKYSSSGVYSKVDLSSGSSFTNNSATSSGGALYWNYNQPNNIESNTYSGNYADEYGDDFACFAQNLKSITEDQYKALYNSRRQLRTLSDSSSVSITNQQSGGSIPTVYIALFDQYGQIVSSDSSSTSTLSISATSSGSTYTPTLTGTVTQSASNGAFKFSGVTFTAQPGATYSLSFTTTGIDTSKPSNAAYLKSSSSATTSLAVSIALRNCITGESFSTNGACVECKGPDYYSLSTQSSPGNCKSCQTTCMYCYGGSNVGPKPGYWRSANTSDNFIACLFSPACLGYVSPSNNNLGECFTGYQGILCADCVPGFSRTSGYECGLCPNQVWNVIRLLLVFIAVIIGIAILIKSTLAGALQKKNVQAVYMKLLMNHIQLLVLASTFQLKWPSRVEDIFSTSEPVAQVSQQILSFDCFIDQRKNGGKNLIDIYYVKMIMYASLPIVMVIGCYFVWTLIYCFIKKSDSEKRNGRIIASIIIMFFLVHPSIVQCMFSNFDCMAIDSESRVTNDLKIVCWGSEHLLYSLAIAFPSIVIWGFGIPLFAWIILARHKEDIGNVEFREKYGFLLNGYKKEYYYWESINMYRKICIIFISIFLKIAGVITQALVVFLVLILFLILNLKLMPYSFQSLNDMELISIITCMLTIYCGIFFLSDMPQVYNSSDPNVKQADNGLRLSEQAKLFFFLIILLSNLFFLSYWSYKMIGEIRNTMRTKMERVYLYLCLCGNEKRLKDEKLKREIQDENDILKEEFDRQLKNIQNLWSSEPKDGKLILNRINIEKSALYLDPKNYMNSIKSRHDPTEEELKEMKRNRRRAEGERKHQILIEQLENSNTLNNSSFYKNSQRTDRNNQSKNLQFTDQIDEFCEIQSSQKVTCQNKIIPEPSIDKNIEESDIYLHNNTIKNLK